MSIMDPDVKTDPNISHIIDSAAKCHSSDGIIRTDDYLYLMHELKKLLSSFHPGLTVIYGSGGCPLKSLEIRRVSGARCYYDNLYTMIQYESDNNLIKGTSKLSFGSVALLRLNRILRFIIQFLKALQQKELANKPFSSKQRINAYMTSLAMYHPVLTRLSCKLALSRCPGRRTLVKQLMSFSDGTVNPPAVLNDLLENLGQVYTSVEELLTDRVKC